MGRLGGLLLGGGRGMSGRLGGEVGGSWVVMSGVMGFFLL